MSAREVCAACGKDATNSGHAIHRDGFSEGPEVPLCKACGSKPTPTCEELWERIALRRAPFRPSEVALVGIPLTGTMGRSEVEVAATIIVRTCAVRGNEWRAVEVKEILEVLRADSEDPTSPLHAVMRNPFWKPDVYELVTRGFARWEGEPGTSAVGLTDAGIEALRSWVVRGGAS